MTGRGARRWHIVARLRRRPQGLGPWPADPRTSTAVVEVPPVAAFTDKARAEAVAARLNAERPSVNGGRSGSTCQYLVVSADDVE